MLKRITSLLVFMAMVNAPLAADAHEFWIDPVSFQVGEDSIIAANNRVGQNLKGEIYPYAKSMFAEFSVIDEAGKRPVRGRLGDLPALRIKPRQSGLHVAAYRSNPSKTTYKSFDKFESFLDEEGLEWAAEAHRSRGLPDAGFGEAFTRFAKSLIAVGDGQGTDKRVGFRFEIVADTNPYTDDGPLSVQLLFEGEPHADAQIAVFSKSGDGKVTRAVVRTDEDGRVTIPRSANAMFLLNAVHLVEPSKDVLARYDDVVWHSLWASLTYATPE